MLMCDLVIPQIENVDINELHYDRGYGYEVRTGQEAAAVASAAATEAPSEVAAIA